MSKVRRTPALWRGASLAATPATRWSPGSDSLAFLDVASLATPSSSRSKKKRMHRSSLEFLGVGGGAASVSDRGSVRSRKKLASFSSALASVTPSSAAEAVPQQRQRQISPRSQSKLNGLARPLNSNSQRLKEKQSRKGKGFSGSEGTAAEKRTTVPAKKPATEPAKVKSAKKSEEGQRKNTGTNATIDESRALTVTNDASLLQPEPPTNRKAKTRAILFTQSNNDTSNAAYKSKSTPSNSHHSSLGKKQLASAEKRAVLFSQASNAPLLPFDHLTPKANRATVRQKQSPGISYSPLDYHPENGADDGESPATNAAATPMMKSYVKQWTKHSPENDGEGNEECHDCPDGGGEAGEERSVNSPRKAESTSSSVISMSSNSDDDDEEGGGHGNDITDESRRLVANQSNGKQCVRLDTEGIFPAPLKLNESLALEYGRLAFLKRELERKMQMQKMDAEMIRPWVYGLPIFGMGSVVATNDVTTNGEEEENYPMDPPNKAIPSREEVAFGEMAFRQMMAEQRLTKSKSGGGWEERDKEYAASPIVDVAAAQNRKINREREGRIRSARRDETPHFRGADLRRGEYGDNYNIHENDEYFDRGNTAMSMVGNSSGPKPKKKRKRRVVETITRVIHEESEEEGASASTCGEGRHGSRLEARPKGGQFSRSMYHGDDDDDNANYIAKEFNGKHTFSPDGGAPRRRIKRYRHEQSDSDSSESAVGDGSINREGGQGLCHRSSPIENKRQPRKQRECEDREPTYNYVKASVPLHEKKRQKRKHPHGLSGGRFHTFHRSRSSISSGN